MRSSFLPALLTSFLISPWLGTSFKSIPPRECLHSGRCREAVATTTRNTFFTTSRTCTRALPTPRSSLLDHGDVHSGHSDFSLRQHQQQLHGRNGGHRNNRNRGRFLMLAADNKKQRKLGEFEAGVQKWFDRATSAFPLWILGAALLGLTRPATMAWFGGDAITCALATTMVRQDSDGTGGQCAPSMQYSICTMNLTGLPGHKIGTTCSFTTTGKGRPFRNPKTHRM